MRVFIVCVVVCVRCLRLLFGCGLSYVAVVCCCVYSGVVLRCVCCLCCIVYDCLCALLCRMFVVCVLEVSLLLFVYCACL